MSETKSKDRLSVLDRIRTFQEHMEGVEILKTTKAYGYYYADLPSILKVIHPVLKNCDLWYVHKTKYDITTKSNILQTVVYCVDDDTDNIFSETLIDGEATIGGMNRFMIEGSAITYFRRYHLTTMLGLVTDEDTDAAGKRPERGGGRSIEAVSDKQSKVDFVAIFTAAIEKKPIKSVLRQFDMYKDQMSNEEIESVQEMIKEKQNPSEDKS